MTHITTHTERRSNRAAVWLSSRACATAVLLCALTWFGHRLVFAQFQDYDDEGYLLVTVQQFLRGLPLYDQVYTQYGPAYYLWQQVLHTLLGIPVTHDATRVVTLVVWLTCAVLVGAIVWLLTKRRLLTALGTIAAFMHLTRMTYEPGHPQELCVLSVLGALALTTWRLVAKTRIGLGGVDGCLGSGGGHRAQQGQRRGISRGALTLGLVTSLKRTRWRTALERIVMAAAMLAVPALMRVDLRRSDIAAYVVVVWCGLLAAFISRSNDDAEEGSRHRTGPRRGSIGVRDRMRRRCRRNRLRGHVAEGAVRGVVRRAPSAVQGVLESVAGADDCRSRRTSHAACGVVLAPRH